MMEIIMIMWKDVCRLNFCVFFFSIKKFYKSVSRWFEEEIKKKVENLIKKKDINMKILKIVSLVKWDWTLKIFPI